MPVCAADIRNSGFFVKIASFRRYWFRLLLSWRPRMRFSTISPRFGHQLTTFVFLRLVFAGDIKNSFFFVKIASFRRYWSRLLLSWRRGMRIFTISARFGHQFASFVFSRLVFAVDIKNSVFFSTGLLVSVDIGLVRPWVGIPGWDFPPYLRGLVINLQRFVSTMPVYAADVRNSILFV